jgi:hypothetical protein
MVQAADFWEGNDIAGRGRLYGTRPRAVLTERKSVTVTGGLSRRGADLAERVREPDVPPGGNLSIDLQDEPTCVLSTENRRLWPGDGGVRLMCFAPAAHASIGVVIAISSRAIFGPDGPQPTADCPRGRRSSVGASEIYRPRWACRLSGPILNIRPLWFDRW